MDTYSDDGLMRLATYLYESAVSIYQSLCDRWFPGLVPTMGLAAMLPVSFTGVISRVEDGAWTGVQYCPISQPSGAPSAADFTLGPPPDRRWIRGHLDIALANLNQFHPQATAWSRPSYIQCDLGGSTDTPATDLPHRWLWDDLARLKIITGLAPSAW
jgi:hypothetical protein